MLIKIYLALGLMTLLLIIRTARREQYDLQESLGNVVLLNVIAWPYVWVVWVFTSDIWLKRLI